MERKDGTHPILWLKCNISWELNSALFLCLLVIMSVGYPGRGDFKSVTDTPNNLMDMHRVAFNILDNSCLILYRASFLLMYSFCLESPCPKVCISIWLVLFLRTTFRSK